MNKHYLWVEKYRPECLNDICSQDNIIKSLKNVLITKNIPHLIFIGPSGSGKTSTILALAKELFGLDYKERIIELNASDERGINIIRDKIKTYAKQSIKNIKNAPPWKIIILDEADTLTYDSQFALRRIIEEYSMITRFCIICNYHNKLIEPIISRCSIFKFKPIKKDEVINKLKFISNNENLIYSDKLLNKITDISGSDLRKAINLLQKCVNLYSDKVNEEILDEISGIIPNDRFNNLMNSVLIKDNINVDILINEIVNDGYSIVNQILLFQKYIINLNICSKKKSSILYRLAENDNNLIKGSDEYIQFMDLIYFIMITI
jgi:replication factor C subunit 2/4